MSNLFKRLDTGEIEWKEGVPFSKRYQDVYFSKHNGLSESRHVFIEGNNLVARWQNLKQESASYFCIAETGFGTGLNFLLSYALWLEHAPNDARLHYFSCEKHPLDVKDLERALALWPSLSAPAQHLLKQWPALIPGSHYLEFEHGRICLTLLFEDAYQAFESLLHVGDSSEELQLPGARIDAWFLDGFSPSKNELMWTNQLCSVVAKLSGIGTTLASFSVARSVREHLETVGFCIEKQPGYGNKREMLCARFEKNNQYLPSSKGQTAWQYHYPCASTEKKAVVVGSGLAGALTAYFLAKRQWQVVVMDKGDVPGTGASANPFAVTFPHISAYDSPLSRLMIQAWQYAGSFYDGYLTSNIPHALNGVVRMDERLINDFKLQQFMKDNPRLGTLLDAKDLSQYLGVSCHTSGYYFPKGGWINGKMLCQSLLDHSGITFLGGHNVTDLKQHDNGWTINGVKTSVVVLATGCTVNQFYQARYLPIKGIRGQMTFVKDSHNSPLKIPVGGTGHLVPGFDGKMATGASYDLTCAAPILKEKDNQYNLERAHNLPIQCDISDNIEDQWAEVRAVCPDYLPIVGQIVREMAFLEHFSSLNKNAKTHIKLEPSLAYRGLYAIAGFGSRGLISAPYCARQLAGIINNERSIISRPLQKSLHPSRFLIRKLVSG